MAMNQDLNVPSGPSPRGCSSATPNEENHIVYELITTTKFENVRILGHLGDKRAFPDLCPITQ